MEQTLRIDWGEQSRGLLHRHLPKHGTRCGGKKEHANLSIETEHADACDSARTPEEQLEYDDRLQRVHSLFNALPERLRTALQLRDIEGMTYQEAAEAMNMSEENFKVTLHRARKALKTQYEKFDNYGL